MAPRRARRPVTSVTQHDELDRSFGDVARKLLDRREPLGDRLGQGVVVQAGRAAVCQSRFGRNVSSGRELEHELLQVVEPVERRHHARERAGRGAVDPADPLPERLSRIRWRKPSSSRRPFIPPPESTSARSRSLIASIVLAWTRRHRSEACSSSSTRSSTRTRSSGATTTRATTRAGGASGPIRSRARRRVHLRRRVHDRRAPRARLAGARRPEPAVARAAREGGRAQPARRLVRARFGPSASYYAWEAAGRPVHGIKERATGVSLTTVRRSPSKI